MASAVWSFSPHRASRSFTSASLHLLVGILMFGVPGCAIAVVVVLSVASPPTCQLPWGLPAPGSVAPSWAWLPEAIRHDHLCARCGGYLLTDFPLGQSRHHTCPALLRCYSVGICPHAHNSPLACATFLTPGRTAVVFLLLLSCDPFPLPTGCTLHRVARL